MKLVQRGVRPVHPQQRGPDQFLQYFVDPVERRPLYAVLTTSWPEPAPPQVDADPYAADASRSPDTTASRPYRPARTGRTRSQRRRGAGRCRPPAAGTGQPGPRHRGGAVKQSLTRVGLPPTGREEAEDTRAYASSSRARAGRTFHCLVMSAYSSPMFSPASAPVRVARNMMLRGVCSLPTNWIVSTR